MEQTPDVRSEIARLNKIIDILTDQIGILKAENRFYKNKFGDKNAGNVIYFSDNGIPEAENTIAVSGNATSEHRTSIVEKGNAPPNVGASVYFSDNGTSESRPPIVEKGNTSPDIRTPIDFSDNGIPEARTPIVQKRNASPDVRTSIAEKGNMPPNVRTSTDFSDNGISNVGMPVSEKVNPIFVNGPANAGKAPAFIEPSVSNTGKLERAIKRFFHIRTKGSKIRSFASQMLLLHNNHYAAYPEMRKVSGLSKPGFNKQAPDLRRKGFVVRASHQKYALTEMSKQIINKVFAA